MWEDTWAIKVRLRVGETVVAGSTIETDAQILAVVKTIDVLIAEVGIMAHLSAGKGKESLVMMVMVDQWAIHRNANIDEFLCRWYS